MIETNENSKVWIFGYGSLIWRCGFEYQQKMNVCIKGYIRRFWQGSTDHRGVPGNPGRVVTLIPNDKGFCYGTAYCVSESDAKIILEGLDYREKGGYERKNINLFLNESDENPIISKAIAYIGTSENTEFLGEAPIKEISKTIYFSTGPSGPNVDYFNNLLKSIRNMNVYDEHIEEIAKEIEELSLQDSLQLTHKNTELSICDSTPSITNTTTTIITPIRIDKNQIMAGEIKINQLAVQEISNLAKSLFSYGVVSVDLLNQKENFGEGSFVNIVDKNGNLIAKGKTNFSFDEIKKFIENNSAQKLNNERGVASTYTDFEHEIISNTNLVLM